VEQYIELVKNILDHGTDVESRAGNCKMLTHQTLSFEMSDGFPRLTNRYVPFNSVAVELEGFIGGITSKKWYQERGCKFWDEWANPVKVQKLVDEHYDKLRSLEVGEEYHRLTKSFDKKTIQKQINDLGPVYGWQWRRAGWKYLGASAIVQPPADFNIGDQLNKVVTTLRTNPDDRRMRVSSVNSIEENKMALPACHDYWKIDKIGNQLDLFFHMRSWDVYLGGPANIQSYAILLHLLARHAKLTPGKLTVFASNAHLYENLLPQAKTLTLRPEQPLPTIKFTHNDFWNWTHKQIECIGYKHSGKLTAEVAV
jgi:thymidylate synthase